MRYTTIFRALLLPIIVKSTDSVCRGHISSNYDSTDIFDDTAIPHWDIVQWQNYTTANWNSTFLQATAPNQFLYIDFNTQNCTIEYWCGDQTTHPPMDTSTSGNGFVKTWRAVDESVTRGAGVALYCDDYQTKANWGVVWAFVFCCRPNSVISSDNERCDYYGS